MTIQVATYSRYSSDELQDERSIRDQQRLCTETIARIAPNAGPIQHYADAGMSGASMIARPGLHNLLRAAQAGAVAIVVAESIDRLSRNQADIARIYELLAFAGVRIVTVEEGPIDEMTIGFKGTMAALFLKGLAAKTTRGLRGVVASGRMAGGDPPFGYRVTAEVGVWAIDPVEAAIVCRIFADYASGRSPLAIARALNAAGMSGPDGCAWSPSTIHGHARRGTGLLRNTLYVGRYVWPKQRYVKDPRTGKRVARVVPEADRGVYDRPHLRIIDDALWEAVKARQAQTAHAMRDGGPVKARRPIHLFSGLTKCGVCGAGYTVHGRDELRCFNRTKRGTCDNRRVITRVALEARVLTALQEKFLADPIAFNEFCAGFVEELNTIRREHRATLAAAPRELAQINKRSDEIKELLLAGYRDERWKAELHAIEHRRADLEQTIATQDADRQPVGPALHPEMATIYRQHVEHLAWSLAHGGDDRRAAAHEAVRSLIAQIVIPPDDGPLMVHGNLGMMLATATRSERDGSALAVVAQGGCGGAQPAWATAIVVAAA